jgi:hypothetical protein
MPRNQKLTAVITGRTVQSATGEPGRLVVMFNDQSTMTVKTTGLVLKFTPPGSAFHPS